jgi:hypothetical protein
MLRCTYLGYDKPDHLELQRALYKLQDAPTFGSGPDPLELFLGTRH